MQLKQTDIEQIAMNHGLAVWDILSQKVRWYGKALPNHDPIGFAEEIAALVAGGEDYINELKSARSTLFAAWSDLVEVYGKETAQRDHISVYNAWKAVANLLVREHTGGTLESDVLRMVVMMENGEWAEHVAKTRLGKRLEQAITALG